MAVADPVSSFLHFGYVPRDDASLLEDVRAGVETGGAPEAPVSPDGDDLLRAGAAALRACFGDVRPGRHVVPLSGGLDSRAILAGLVEAGLSDDLVTVTIGTPGTLDFEIAARVARRAGVAHEAIDLRAVPLDEEGLMRAVVDAGAATWAFDAFYHRLIPARFGPGATYWSGFIGGELAGSHVPAQPHPNWAGAVRDFAAHAGFCRGDPLARPGFRPEDELPERPWYEGGVLAYGDQLDFGVRQQSYILPTVVVAGHDYRTPFLTPAWLRFVLALPQPLRHRERLYKQLLVTTFPDLFSLPSTGTAGLAVSARPAAVTAKVRWLKAAAAVRRRSVIGDLRRRRPPMPFAMLGYLDFAAALRSRPDVRETILGLLRALDRRGVAGWVDSTALWEAHERSGGDFDLACALTLLASLELNLRADALRPEPFFGS